MDILKCIAAIVITNSHMELLYGECSALATGGAIGDVLFFFCSGFTLFMGRGGRFDNWYKRRINRIYPTVFAWAFIAALLFGSQNTMVDTIICGGGWFVSCIMLYYVVLYFIRRWLMSRLKWVMAAVFAGCGLWFVFADTPSDFNMYGNTYFKWFHYFLFMLFGAMMGVRDNSKLSYSFGMDSLKLLAGVVCFYGLFFLMKLPALNKLHFLSILPLGTVVYYSYKVCNSQMLLRLYHHKILGWLIRLVGGLCLEIYLIQGVLLTDKMNSVFPLNIPIMFVVIVCAAYLLRCCARFFAQTFKDMDYDWNAVIKAQ